MKTAIFPLLLVLYEMAIYLSNDLYLPALPNIMQELQISSYWAQMTLTAWLLGSASLQLIIGPISDRFGRRPLLLYGGIVFIAASLLCALADDITILLIARFFQGAVVATVIVPGYASIHELLDSEKAIKTLAWMGAVVVLAPAFGPLLGGILLLFNSWRLLFVILVIWGAFVLLALLRWMPESLPKEKRQILHLKRVFKDYWLICCSRAFIINTATFCLIFCSVIAWIVISPLLLIRDFHLSPVGFGLVQVFVFGSFIVGTRLIKLFMRKLGITATLNFALMAMLIGAGLALLSALIWPQQFLMFIGSLMIFELAAGLSLAPLNRLAIESVTQPMGMRMAVFSSLMGWFAVIASGLATIVYNGQIYSLAWLMLAFTISALLLKFSSKLNTST